MPITAPQARPATQLAAAARVVDRHDGLLQVGIRPEACIRVPDTPRLRRALADIARGERGNDQDPHLVTALHEAGLVSLPSPPGPFAIRIWGTLDSDISTALRWAGLSERADAKLVLYLSNGEIDRADLDPLVRSGIPHLIVRALDGVLVVGPFVIPGQTACIRCIDAHHTDDDPGYPIALEQYVLARGEPREDGCLDIVSPGDTALALAWAARDLRAHSMGDLPTTWSSTVVIGDPAGSISAVTWEPHPSCGCRWADQPHLVA